MRGVELRTLSKSAIDRKLEALPGWKYVPKAKAIRMDHKAKDFMGTVRLIAKIARLAEKADHHPDLHLTAYRRLRIVLSTHSLGGVSPKDFALAKKISALF